MAALFGPESGTTSTHIQSICDAMEIPHIETRWDYMLRRDDYSINLYPNPKVISKVKIRYSCQKVGDMCKTSKEIDFNLYVSRPMLI